MAPPRQDLGRDQLWNPAPTHWLLFVSLGPSVVLPSPAKPTLRSALGAEEGRRPATSRHAIWSPWEELWTTGGEEGHAVWLTAYPRAAAVLPAGSPAPRLQVWRWRIRRRINRDQAFGAPPFLSLGRFPPWARLLRRLPKVTASFLAECRGWDQTSQLQSTAFHFHQGSGV